MKKQILSSLIIIITLGFSLLANASAPMATTASTGFFRMHLGAFEVTAISDGTVDLPMSKILTQIKAPEYQKAIDAAYLTDPVETSDNAFLVNTGAKLVLIDTGAGSLFGPTLGKMVANLKAAGYQPEQVDVILITHMHPDHVGGLVANDKIVFQNATVYTDKAESDFWLSAENMAKAPEANKGFFQGAMASLNPYVKAGKVEFLSADTEIVPGIKSHASHGHTAGHTTYFVESQGKKLALIGDLIHLGAVQFAKPNVRIQFDTDQDSAEKQRRAAFDEAAKEGYMIGAAHLAFPGIGHVRKVKKSYEYIPVNYTR